MSQSMRGAISRAKGHPVELVDIAMPEAAPGEAAVTVQAAIDHLGGESSAASDNPHHKAAMGIGWFDRKIVEFILAWAPYDGPTDDEAFPEFGISTAELRVRFIEIVAKTTQLGHVTGADDRALLDRAHAYYLHITHQPPPSVAPHKEEGLVATPTGTTAATRSQHSVPVRYRSPSPSPQFSDAVSNEGR